MVVEQVERLRNSTGNKRVADIRKELQETMDANVMVFRTEQTIKTAVEKIGELRDRYRNVAIQDKGKRFNTDLLEAVELGFLIDLAEVLVVSALARKATWAPLSSPVTYSVFSSGLRMIPLPPTVPNRPMTSPLGLA